MWLISLIDLTRIIIDEVGERANIFLALMASCTALITCLRLATRAHHSTILRQDGNSTCEKDVQPSKSRFVKMPQFDTTTLAVFFLMLLGYSIYSGSVFRFFENYFSFKDTHGLFVIWKIACVILPMAIIYVLCRLSIVKKLSDILLKQT
jgi:hypothetical protein